MTASASRGLVVAVAALLTCSLALGAATPVAAGDALAGDDDYLGAGLDLGETVGGTVDVAGDLVGDDTNASRNGSDPANGTTNGTANGTSADGTGSGEPTSTPEQTSTPEPTPEQTSTPEPTPAETPDDRTNDSSAVGAVGETVEAVGEGASETVNRTSSAAGSTVNETVNGTTTGVDETVDTTGSAVDGTVNETGETVAETVEGTGEPVEGTTNATTGLVGDATDGATDTVEDTTDGTTDSVEETAGTTTDGTADATATIDRAVGEVTGSVGNATVDGAVRTVVDGTTTVVVGTTDALTTVVGGTAEETGSLLEDAVSGSTWHDDGGVGEAYGHPTTSDGTSAAGHAGSWSGAGTDASTLARAPPEALEGGDDAEESGTDAAASDGSGADGEEPSDGGFDPTGGGAAVGAALLIGSLVATRSGSAATSMGAGGTALPRTLLAVLRDYAVRLGVLAGYSRYDFEDPLENENRAAVLEAVESSPGVNLTSLVEATGLAESTLRYHLRVLEHEDLLEAAKVRGRRRYVPRTDDDLELLAAFEEESTKDVLAALFEHEPATGTTLAEALERDPSTVSHHLSRLAEAGLVDREQDGPALRNSLTPKARRAFSEVEATSSRRGYATADD